ncbi:hypothetical protein B0H14DRAFT_2625932 [Mycena olivaceomarginata]|nr:hypothetical protein B0H14DRAFT_2625932 [Mycena olivaceomarginata]
MKALAALVPYVARIESLDVEYSQYSTYPLSPPAFQALLRSNLEFPALQTLRLKGPHRHLIPRLLLKTPRLRILDLEYFDPEDLDTLLPLSLENIRLHQVDVEGVETLFISSPDVRGCGALCCSHATVATSRKMRFPASQLIALALRELEVGWMNSADVARILNTCFSDVVLHTLAAWSLVVFEASDPRTFEVRDEGGRIRRFQGVSIGPVHMAAHEVWEQLSSRHNLHKTVRELRIRYWDDYVDIFERCPPQHDGITLVVGADSDFSVDFAAPDDSSRSDYQQYMSKTMRIAGLTKVEIYGPDAYLRVATIMHVLAHIEPPTRQVEVCVGNRKLVGREDIGEDVFDVLQTALLESCWTICSQCLIRCAH